MNIRRSFVSIRIGIMLLIMLSVVGCGSLRSYKEARNNFETTLSAEISVDEEIKAPPEGELELVYYTAPLGEMAAYISKKPDDNKKHPAIIWVAGGFDNSIGASCWEDAMSDNDQSASVFRENGVVTMYPSFRGGNENKGYLECLYGEIDDILAAYDYLANVPYVDNKRIYLGGHSTGGTAALLTAEASEKFRAVFAFGPVAYITNYSYDNFTFDAENKKEYKMRSPAYWLNSISTPTYIFEGDSRPSNASSLMELKEINHNSMLNCYLVKSKDHFSILAPVTRIISEKINNDVDSVWNQTFTDEELTLRK